MSNTRKRFAQRSAAGLSATVLVASGFAFAAAPAFATSNFTTSRIAGQDRFDTAAMIATQTFQTANTVIIANGDTAHIVDALSANFLAGVDNAPILLTHVDQIPSQTQSALQKLAPKNIILVGDENSISAAQQSAYQSGGATVTRLGGTTRYDTMKAIVEAGKAGVGSVNGQPTAIIASGNDAHLADALAGGAAAFGSKLPVIITDSASLSPQAQQALTDLGIKQVLILGDTNAVSQADQNSITAMGITVLQRFAGTNRSDTSVQFANWLLANLGYSNSTVDVASGAQLHLVDALADGPHAGTAKAPIIETYSVTDPGQTVNYATAHSSTLNTATFLGDQNAIASSVETSFTNGAKTQPAAATNLPQLVSAQIVKTVTPAQANASNPQGTTVTYTFSHPVITATAANFKLYPAAGGAATTAAGGTATVSGSTVTVLFPSITATSGGGATDASTYSLAAVASPAVTDSSGQNNPDGSAPVGTSSSTTTQATANTTTAPDLRSVSNPRQANPATYPNSTAVDFTFDQAAVTTSAAPAPANFHLIMPDGTVINCTGPASTDTTTGGGTIPGGNGTTTITVVCPNPGGSATTLTAANIARGYVDAGAVKGTSTTPPPSNNVLQSANVTNGGLTTGADLQSATFAPSGSASNPAANNVDQVVYTFDQAVTGIPANGTAATGFNVFKSDATVVTGGTVSASSTDGKQIVVNFPKGTLTNAVGASIDATATTTNTQPASVGVTPVATSTTSVTPGVVAEPQLASVKIIKSTDVLGNTTYTAAYTFTYAVTAGPATAYHLYTQPGARYDGSTCAVNASNNKEVDCTAFTGVPATSNIGTAVLGTVDNGAVTGNTAATTNTSPTNNANPEGAANVSS